MSAPDRNEPAIPQPAAARRALEEAEERRRRPKTAAPPEIGGPAGPEPTRYGDWEKNGIASDF